MSSKHSTSTAAIWAEKRKAVKPLTPADLRAIRRKFHVQGDLKVVDSAPNYAIDSTGRLFSNRATLKEAGELREMQPSVEKSTGYRFAYISRDGGKRRNIRIHKLVALTFVANKSGGKLVLHRDGDPSNNGMDNLYWGSHVDNVADARRHGRIRMGSRSPKSKATEEQIAALRLASTVGLPIAAMAAELGYSPHHAVAVASGSYWPGVPSGEELLASINATIANWASMRQQCAA